MRRPELWAKRNLIKKYKKVRRMNKKTISTISPFTGVKKKRWRICGRGKITARAGIKGYDGPTNGR